LEQTEDELGLIDADLGYLLFEPHIHLEPARNGIAMLVPPALDPALPRECREFLGTVFVETVEASESQDVGGLRAMQGGLDAGDRDRSDSGMAGGFVA